MQATRARVAARARRVQQASTNQFQETQNVANAQQEQRPRSGVYHWKRARADPGMGIGRQRQVHAVHVRRDSSRSFKKMVLASLASLVKFLESRLQARQERVCVFLLIGTQFNNF